MHTPSRGVYVGTGSKNAAGGGVSWLEEVHHGEQDLAEGDNRDRDAWFQVVDRASRHGRFTLAPFEISAACRRLDNRWVSPACHIYQCVCRVMCGLVGGRVIVVKFVLCAWVWRGGYLRECTLRGRTVAGSR